MMSEPHDAPAPVDPDAPCPHGGPSSFERASGPLARALTSIHPLVLMAIVVALVLAGSFLPPPGWLLIVPVIVVLAWVLALGWSRRSPSERLMQVSVIFLLVAICAVRAVPR